VRQRGRCRSGAGRLFSQPARPYPDARDGRAPGRR